MRRFVVYFVLTVLAACAVALVVLVVRRLQSAAAGLDPVIAVLVVFMVFVVMLVHGHWRFEDQRLRVFVPIPENTPHAKALQLLGPGDVEIYFYLVTRGKTVPRPNGMIIEYVGPHVYRQFRKDFKIDGKRYVPKAVVVEHHL